MTKTNLQRFSVIAALGIALAAFGMKPAAAQSTTFAQFSQQPVNGNTPPLFVFTNTGATSSFTSGPIPVYFVFDGANSYTGGPFVAATLTITGTVSGPAITNGTPVSVTQPFSNLDLTFTDSHGNTLLTADASNTVVTNNPSYVGSQGSQGGAVGGSVTDVPPAQVTFASQYIDPALLAADQNFSVTFSSLTDIIAGDTTVTSNGPTVNANGYLDSFDANATGTFAAAQGAPAVPEPSSALILAMAGAAVLGLVVIKKRSTSISA